MDNSEVIFGIGADTSPFARTMRKLTGEAGKQGQALGKGMADGFKRGFNIGDIGKNLVAGFGVAAAVASVTGFIKSIDRLTEETIANSEAAGVGTDFWQGWNFAASQANVTTQAAAKSLNMITRAIGEARDGNEEAIKKFSKLGVALNDVNRNARASEEVVFSVADALAGIEDPTIRAAMAQDLLGKSWEKSLPMFLQGGDALRKLVAEASKLSPEDLKAIDQLSDSWKAFVKSLQVEGGVAIGIFASIGDALGDAFGGDWDQAFLSHLRRALGSPELGKLRNEIEMLAHSIYGVTLEGKGPDTPGDITQGGAAGKAAAKAAAEDAKIAEKIAKIIREMDDVGKTDGEKLNQLLAERVKLGEELMKNQTDAMASRKLELAVIENIAESAKLEQKIKEENLKLEKEAADAQQDFLLAGATAAEKFKILRKEILALQKEFNSAADDELKQKKIGIELDKKKTDLLKAQVDLTKDQKKAAEDLKKAKQDATGLTVEEVADMPFLNGGFARTSRGRRQLVPLPTDSPHVREQKARARNILDAEDDAQDAKESGRIDLFKQFSEEALELRKGLDPTIFKSTEIDQFADMTKSLKDLAGTVQNGEVKVSPANGK